MPILDALAKKFTEIEGKAVSVGEVFDKISSREVPFEMVRDVLWDLTNEGGMFYNMQSQLANTLSGKLEKLGDSYKNMMSDIADSNNDILGGGIDMLTKMMGYWEDIAKVVWVLVNVYGVYKGTLIALTAAQTAYNTVTAAWKGYQLAAAAMNLSRAMSGLTLLTKRQTAAQLALNLATKVSPIGWVATGLSVAAGAFMMFRKEAKSTDETIQDLNESTGKLKQQLEENRKTGELIEEYDELRQKQSLTSEESERLGTLTDTLNGKFLSSAHDIDTYQGKIVATANSMRELNKENRDFIVQASEAGIAVARDQIAELEKRRKTIEDLLRAGTKQVFVGGGMFNGATIIDSKLTNEEIVRYKKELDRVNGEIKELNAGIDQSNKRLRESKIATGEIKEELTGWRKVAREAYNKNGFLPEVKEDTELNEYLKTLKSNIDGLEKSQQGISKTNEFTKKQWADQNNQLRIANELYTKLGGVDKSAVKANDKADTDQFKSDKAYLKAQEALNAQKVKMELELERSIIDTKEEGFEKEMALIRLNHSKRMAELDKETQEIVKKAQEEEKAKWMSDNPGAKEKDFTPTILGVDSLPEKFKNILQDLVDTENQLYKKSISDYFESVTSEFKGYLEKRKQIEEDFAKKRDVLFKAKAPASSFEELDIKEDEALKQLDVQIAERERAFREWAASIADMSVDQLRQMLMEAESELHKLEILSKMGKGLSDVTPEELARQRAMVVKIREELEKVDTKNSKTDAGDKNWKKLYSTLNKVNGEFKNLGDTIGGTVGEIIKSAGDITTSTLNMINGINQLAKSSVNATKTAATGASAAIATVEKASVILTVVSAALSVVTGIFKMFKRTDYIAQYRKEVDKLNYSLAKAKFEAKLASDEFSTIFGDDGWRKAKNDIDSAREALGRYNDTLKDISGRSSLENVSDKVAGLFDIDKSEFKFDNLKDSLKNMLVQVKHSTWFRDAKYDTLANAAPELFDEDGGVNMDALAEFVNTDMFKKLSEENQQYLTKMLDNWDQYEEALGQVKEYLQGVFGDLGNTMMDALVDSFENGTDAAKSFTESVSEMLEKLARDMIYSVTLAPIFEKAQEQMLAIMGDGTKTDEAKFEAYSDVLKGVTDEALAQQELAKKLMEQYQDMAEENGQDIFTPDNEKQSGLSESIKGVTEDTANLLGSYLNAIRHDVSVKRGILEEIAKDMLPGMSVIAEAQLQQLNAIAENTANNAKSAEAINAFLQGTLAGVITQGKDGKAIRIK